MCIAILKMFASFWYWRIPEGAVVQNFWETIRTSAGFDKLSRRKSYDNDCDNHLFI